MSRCTHAVFNQSTPFVDVNLFTTHRALADALSFNHAGFDAARFAGLGAEMGSAEMQRHARLANTFTPQLRTHDRYGHRVDQVDFHPSYHALLAAALRHRLHGAPWSAGTGGHVERAAAFMLFTECEPSVLCPVSMSYAVMPALRANAAIYAEWAAGLTSDRYDQRFLPFQEKTGLTMGMGITEKQGGSDVRAITSRADIDGEDAWGRRYRITGHKWFFSAPMCDAFLVLAQTPGGLSCLFLPRILPDGTVNTIAIQRLKHKLGNHANASSEVEFDAACAWLVGDEGRGVPQILAMGALTRLDCALGTAGLMRHALSLALHHTAQRQAFGRSLADQPVMKNVLADLALESEAATALALRLARAVDHSENGQDASGHETLCRRLLTPIAKFWICKRGSLFAQEAMESLGGNGYVEEQGEGVMARIYREMPLNSIWEGAGNIMVLDLLRALRAPGMASALEYEISPVRRAHPALERTFATTLQAIDGLREEAQARCLARDLALLLQAALLRQHACDAVFDAFCASRFEAAADVFGLLPAGVDLDAIITRAMPVQMA
ncbi:isovaleryl-CoA dehydrogenase [Candidatus Accumulibacter cognatus]|uniref:Acyl-CoA dehydrogenase AidB n=1 Tax=Candidatus Accumulibacter cognatus TaxID=2954383 RepID=A0A080M300_9PROT|nr:isovaleryl-CoA dehydrogenase [Candidatus Accumulibacter cognatus]KFB75466.1 MAG: putative acyl-CoA dehydrogenase AidB [Candidatus Accumulibacter cognatus]